MSESEYFKKQKQASLNNLQNNPNAWSVDIKYFQRVLDAVQKAKFELEDGIILRLQVERQKQLEQYVVKNCYQNKTYNFLQAQKCEEFHYKNDYKLNILNSFFNDHIVKHLNEYEKCWKSPEFDRLNKIEDKDLAFLECHERWVNNLRNNIVPDLEIRAKELLQ